MLLGVRNRTRTYAFQALSRVHRAVGLRQKNHPILLARRSQAILRKATPTTRAGLVALHRLNQPQKRRVCLGYNRTPQNVIFGNQFLGPFLVKAETKGGLPFRGNPKITFGTTPATAFEITPGSRFFCLFNFVPRTAFRLLGRFTLRDMHGAVLDNFKMLLANFRGPFCPATACHKRELAMQCSWFRACYKIWTIDENRTAAIDL